MSFCLDKVYAIIVTISSLLLLTSSVSVSQPSNQPSLEFKPEPPKDEYGGTFLWVNRRNYQTHVDALNYFLKVYKVPALFPGQGQNLITCDYDNPPPKGKFCHVDVTKFPPCTENGMYGYNRSAPCIFLKLKNIPNWVPEYYNDTSALPENMPEYLKSYITYAEFRNPKSLNTLWVSCEGESHVDVEFRGPIVFSAMGFPGYYFPMENEEEYMSPLIAIHFEHPEYGIAFAIECKMWARNIVQDRNSLKGMVRFQLLVE